MTDLNYRRAKFVYEGTRIAAVAAEAPIVPEPYDEREPAFREQFERVIEHQMGPERSSNAEALHEDWVHAYEEMGWVYGPIRDPGKKTHPDMVPYAELGHLERDKDAVFVALCEIARKWVHPEGEDCDDKQELEKRVAELDNARVTIERLRAVVDGAQDIIEELFSCDPAANIPKTPQALSQHEWDRTLRMLTDAWGPYRDDVMPAMGDHSEEYKELYRRMRKAADQVRGA